MKWIGISGGWRTANEVVEHDVRTIVQSIFNRGDGIVSGGALNVDYIATDEALKLNPEATRIKVFLPVTLERYSAHYRNRAKECVITSAQAEMLIEQLTRLKSANPDALIEHPRNTVCDETTYYERNMEVINASDELCAFWINRTAGTKDAIEKAKSQGKPVSIHSYEVP
ncbi:MAG: hypothetical protein V4682_00660 [Patescibacteria group bacterium]